VAGAGGRIEALRFSLLIVLTVALLSVAFRINSQSSSHSANVPRPLPKSSSRLPSSTPSTSGPASSGSASSSPSSPTRPSPSVLPTRTARPGGSAGSGAGGTGGTASQTLPVTGWDNAMRLGGLSFLLIGGGTFAIRLAGPRRRPR
jgi:hypothetical protein